MLRHLATAPDLLSSHAIAFHLTEGKLEQFELPNMGAYAHFVISERALCVVSSEYASGGVGVSLDRLGGWCPGPQRGRLVCLVGLPGPQPPPRQKKTQRR